MQPIRFVFRLALRWLAVISAGALISACQAQAPHNAADNAAEEPAVNLPTLPLPEPPLGRAELLSAVAQAASASASGADDRGAQRELDGRPFELRIRFGCRGPAPELPDGPLAWSYDAEKRTLRIRAAPTISAEEPLVRALVGESFEAVEGFWIPRPWLLQAVCPAAPPPKPAPPSEQASATAQPTATPGRAEEQGTVAAVRAPRVGIAQFFSSTDARTRRRDMRPYQAVKSLGANETVGTGGFDFILSGRLRALPDNGVIACSSASPDSAPECIISAEFDRVWIEDPRTRDLVAEWRSP